ncbi:hypothetical protein ABKS89_12305 [Pseudomonas sp. LABIM340]|uniref:hypothetical protein n=1 Tax=Pseudomonas sp. LABIM340 TaxID=3156585 RepID=UPI0032AE88AC
MGLLDREWFRDARSHNEGQQSAERAQTGLPRQQQRSIDPEDLAKAKTIPPAHAVLAARYEVAIRAKTKKIFIQGYLFGVATCAMIFAIIFL